MVLQARQCKILEARALKFSWNGVTKYYLMRTCKFIAEQRATRVDWYNAV